MKRTIGRYPRARTHSAAALFSLWAFGLTLSLPLAGSAQAVVVKKGGVARSGMEQGEALINVRSDVKVAISGTPGTKLAHLQQLSEVISDRMGAVRDCYTDLVKKRPATVGGLELRILLEEGKKKPKRAKLELTERDGTDDQLTSCVRKVFKKADYAAVPRPAGAIVELSFANTGAVGSEKMTAHREATEVQVMQREGGGYQSSYTTPDRRVSFVVSSPRSDEAVKAATGTLRTSFAAFLDCRRRAAKDGLSPAGTLEVAVRLQRGGKASGKVKSSTVAHERVIPCVERAFRRIKFKDSPAGRPVHVQVTFRQ